MIYPWNYNTKTNRLMNFCCLHTTIYLYIRAWWVHKVHVSSYVAIIHNDATFPTKFIFNTLRRSQIAAITYIHNQWVIAPLWKWSQLTTYPVNMHNDGCVLSMVVSLYFTYQLIHTNHLLKLAVFSPVPRVSLYNWPYATENHPEEYGTLYHCYHTKAQQNIKCDP